MFEMDIIEQNKMLNLIKNIYKDYPKWAKRGNK